MRTIVPLSAAMSPVLSTSCGSSCVYAGKRYCRSTCFTYGRFVTSIVYVVDRTPFASTAYSRLSADVEQPERVPAGAVGGHRQRASSSWSRRCARAAPRGPTGSREACASISSIAALGDRGVSRLDGDAERARRLPSGSTAWRSSRTPWRSTGGPNIVSSNAPASRRPADAAVRAQLAGVDRASVARAMHAVERAAREPVDQRRRAQRRTAAGVGLASRRR